MSWLLLALAAFAGVTKGYCGKKTSAVTAHLHDAVYVGVVRFGMCALLGGVICIVQGGVSVLGRVDGLWVAVVSGVAQAAFATTWLLAVRTGAYVMLDAFLTAGILLPSVLCHVLYDERIKPLQWLGFAVLIGAVCLMCSYSNSIKKRKLTPWTLLLLLACSASCGMVDFLQKVLSHNYPNDSVAAFNFYAYAAAMLASAVVVPFVRPKGAKPVAVGKFAWYLAVMAACLFLNSYFKFLAARHIDAAIMYPVCQGSGLVLSALMAAVMFREPVKKRSIVGLILVFGAMMLITFA